MASTVNLVAVGVGVAIVPESMCQIHPEGDTYVRIADPSPAAMLWVAHRHIEATLAAVPTTACTSPECASKPLPENRSNEIWKIGHHHAH